MRSTTSTAASSARRPTCACCSAPAGWPRPPRPFRAHVERHAPDALDELAEELDGAPATALLCLEAEPAACHPRVIADALCARRPGLRVVDL